MNFSVVFDFIYELNHAGIKIWTQNQNIKIFIPEGITLTDTQKNFITLNKNKIIDCLQHNQAYSKDHNVVILSSRQDEVPLAFAQERLWFIEKYEEGTQAYNIPLIFKLSKETKLDLLEKSLRSIVNRHEILRTVIREDEDGTGYQLVMDDQATPLNINKIKVTTQDELNEAIKQEVNHVYDLSQEWPIRIGLYESNTGKRKKEHYLSIVIHHIAFDGWSADILLKELKEYYRYYLEQFQSLETVLNLPPLTIQYKDFALWQRNYLSGERLEKQLRYWRTKLAGYETLNLMTDQPRPNQVDYRGANASFELDAKTSTGLRELAKELKVSLYSVLLSGYYLMLRAYSYQNNIVVGTPIANRHYSQIENLIGFFINSLALRMEIDPKASIKEFIQKVGQEVIEAQLHQDLPFEKLVEQLKVEKDTSRHPIFQVVFGVQSFARELYKPANGEAGTIWQSYTPEEKLSSAAKFDISTFIDDSESKLKGNFNYATSLYAETTITGFIETYLEILKQIIKLANDSQARIAHLNYLNKRQYLQIIHEWNDTDKDYLSEQTIQALFEEQVERTPNHIALMYEDKKLTYRELNERANQLANYLGQTYDIQPDTLIVLCLDRSEQMLIAILAVLKSGGAYVPMDPSYPDERIKYILEDTQAKVVLTNEVYHERLKELNTNKIINVIAIDDDKIQKQLKAQSHINPVPSTQSHHLAYVIYTSGTTGKPKGVMIEHRGVVNYIGNIKRYVSFSPQDKVDFSTNVGFDLTVTTLFCSLCLGSQVIIYRGKLQDLESYKEHLIQNDINVIKLTPNYLELIVDTLPETKINRIIVGGDKLAPSIINRIANLYDDQNKNDLKVYDEYGPTEATVGTCHSIVYPASTLTIGKPYDNYKVYVVDEHLIPLPIGAVGELYIGGEGLARGYLNRPELTAERFIKNPFQTVLEKKKNKNGRLYKTGDLVRWLPDGNLEYIGRNDFQVKIRGYRIELGEIETILSSYEKIKQSVALVKNLKDKESADLSDSMYLVGYYVSENKLDEGKILCYLSNKLPDYMVPNVLVHLDELPLTGNGKLDRKALPKPELIQSDDSVAPRNEIEKTACRVWAEVLSLREEEIGICDDFFSLGGNSILAMKLVNQLNKAFSSHLHVSDIFRYSTIEELTGCLGHDNTEDNVVIPKAVINRVEDQRLSFAQERLWFIEKYEGGTQAYNVPLVFKLSKNTKLAILENSLRSIVKRHEILRTLIKEDEEGHSYQLVVAEQEHPLVFKKLTLTTSLKLDKAIKEEANYIYDLSQECPIRISLYELILSKNKKEHYLIILMHHIAFDGWSADILLKELKEYYRYYLEQSKGKKSVLELPPLSIQYKDFALWQRSYLSGERLEKQLSYWRNKLEGYETLNLITDKIRPNQVDYKGASLSFELDILTSTALRELAKELKVSLYSVLLGGYYLMLRAYSNQQDIVVGTPIANRHYSQIENLIGFFINSLALRIKIDSNVSIKEFIQKVGQEIIEAQLHQDLPFEKLVEELKVEKDTSRHPIFQVMFGVQSFAGELYKQVGEEEDILWQAYTPEEKLSSVAKFDISTFIDDSESKLKGSFNYATSLYTETTINRLIETYTEILKQLANLIVNNRKREQTKILDLRYLNKNQYRQVIHDWNDTDKEYPREKTIQALFEEQVERTPDNIAVIYEERKLTYRELNEKANRLANYLRQTYDIQPDTLIALCLDRSEQMLIAILAVLKAGGAYVPMDPSYPDERLKYVLEDTQGKVVLTNESYEGRLKELSTNKTVHVIAIDDKKIQKQLESQPSINPVTATKSYHLAYVIYTSGTTGQPKGVMIEHKGVLNLVIAREKIFRLDSKEIKNCLWYSNYVFDVHVAEIYIVLIRGHKLYIANDETRQDTVLLGRYIQTNHIQLALLTPLLLDKEEVFRLETLVVGGDVPKKEILNNYYRNNIKVVNAYGPTEITVGATFNCYHDDGVRNIGSPIANVQCYVLDSHLKPLPIGAVGELYIGGEGLARGYLNRPELTAERFIKNPFQTEVEKKQKRNGRLYKTGDLVRWLPEGNLEYIGRNDFQVKIRGYRIELGEIENVLSSYKGIKQSVVLVRERKGIEEVSAEKKYLVGYYVSEDQLDEEKILIYLSSKLPDYMIPSVLVHLNKLPLTINGKLDRKALPEPELIDSDRYVAPRDEIEQRMCQVWAEVLGLAENEIGITEDFFRLGGNSILAIKLISKINKEFHSHLNVSAIFKYPTIERQVYSLKNSIKDDSEDNVVIHKAFVNKIEEQRLSFAQERLWFIEKYEEGTQAYNIPMVFKLTNDTKLELLENSLRSIVNRHEILRTIIKEDEEGAGYQIVMDDQVDLLKIDKIKVTTENELNEAIKQEVNHVYDLSQEWPIRISLFELTTGKKQKGHNGYKEHQEYYLSLVIHHIAFDGWSADILLKELKEYYRYYLEQSKGLETKLNLPNLTIQYKDFALWQRSYLRGERLEKQLTYWRVKLEGYETLNLITDKIRPNQIDYRGASIHFELDEETSTGLRELAKELKVSLYSVLLSGYYLMLRVYSYQNDIVIGAPIANRHYSQIENLIGFFINSLALRTKIDSNISIKEFIQKVGQEVVEAQLYQDLPFEKLVEELKVEKDTSRHPIFQVMFAVQKFGDELHKQEADWLQAYTAEKGLYNAAKFDISTFVDDGQNKLRGSFNYATSLYTETTITGFIETYLEVLRQMVKLTHNQQAQIANLSYLNKKQYKQIIHEWNDTDKEYPREKTIQALFEEQVEKTPDHIAVIYVDRKLTYRELNERANRLGDYLKQSYDIQPDTLISLCLDRSEQMLIAILAVLKAGGAYVPMDPSYPDERIKYILEDTQAKVVLTNEAHQERLKELSRNKTTNVIAIDNHNIWKRLEAQSPINPVSATKSYHLAYVIYTSGTTGQPKGVLQLHSNVMRLFKATEEWYGFNHKDIWTLFHSYVFDFTVWEMWGALVYGGKLVIPTLEQTKDLNLFYELCQREKVTILNLTPTAFYQFADIAINQEKENKLIDLRYVIFGGEALNLLQLKPWFNYYGYNKPKLINMYGITETTVHVTYKPINEKDIGEKSNIGQRIPDLKVYILDSTSCLVPIGAIGELYVGGEGLARGYLNRPELTAERFIKNPFQTEAEKKQSKNGRLYKTGDLVRWLSDGNLEYIGRNDFQVKIRGYRIELGEIENVLSSYKGIKQSVVLVRERKGIEEVSTENKYLVGYYVSEDQLDEEKILSYLSSKLPDYMVPTVLVYLDKLSLTINGKLDKKVLPEPKYVSDDYIAPQNEVEKKLCKIWSEILELPLDKIGIRDNFFRLGGDSILAIRLVSKLGKEFKSKIKVKDVFELKYIDKLAKTIVLNENIRTESDSYKPYSLINIEKYKNIIDTNLVEDIYPASYLQMGMLLESSLNDNNTYHNVSSYSLNVVFKEDKFLHIWKELVEKHELLRAKFMLDNDWDVVIYKNIEIDYKLYVNKVAKEIVAEERLNDFDYNKPGLFRLIVNDLGNSFDLIFSFHHAIEDGWSMASLMNEFIQAYVNGKSIIQNLNLRYGEFVKNELIAIKDENNISFWKKYLEDLNIIKVKWKFDAEKSDNSLYISKFDLSAKEAKKVHQIAKDKGISIDSLFLLAYLKTLSFFTNSNDLTLGLVVNNRLEKEGGDRLFGLFLNTIPFRFNTNDQCIISDELLMVFNNKINLYKYKQLPYAYIKSLYNEELYDFAFNFVHFHALNDSISNIDSYDGYQRTNIPFVLNVSQLGNSFFRIVIRVHDSYISKEYLEYFTRYYKECLINIVIGKKDKLGLIEEDHVKLIKYWNDTDKEYPREKTIQALFEEQVERTPDNIAVIYEKRKLTYRELNEKANRLANYLRQTYDIQPDTLIALCLDRSEQMLIAILAVLKAGAAYVPMDPSYPDERLKYVLEDTQAKAVLTNEPYEGRLKELSTNKNTHVIAIDDKKIQKQLESQPSINRVTATKSHHLAYVIYTSGTTGKPRGVLIEHKQLVNYTLSITKRFPLSQKSSFGFISTVAADLGHTSIYGALINGRSLHIIPSELSFDADKLAIYMSNYEIGGLKITPSHLNSLLECSHPKQILPKECLVLGGEPATWELAKRIKNLSPNLKLFNHYGPTETTVGASVYDFSDLKTNYNSKTIPLGRALDNIKMYVVDGQLKAVPTGVVGELYIGGEGLARGYLNRPKLTAERFVKNPFQTDLEKKQNKNERLYKTGDLVRWLPDGNLEYIGRNDFQVKIRGYRIELGEIESALSSYEGIKQSVVLTKERKGIEGVSTENKYLVGYYVSEHQLDEEKILSYLSNKLPDYMVPSVLVHLDKLPLTINGKLDRKALPEPELTDSDRYVAPRDEIEQRMCQVWTEVLGLAEDKVGIKDDFFRLGGNSILAIKLISKLNKELHSNLSVSAIFKYPTIERLVYSLKNSIKDDSEDNVVINKAIVNKIEEQRLSFAQERLWFIENYEEGTQAYNVPLILQLSKETKLDLLEKSLRSIVSRHEILRTVIREDEEGNGYQLVIDDQTYPLEIERISVTTLSELNERMRQEVNHVYDLSQEWPTRICLYELTSGKKKKEHYLTIVIHHIAFDGWSADIFLKELKEYYRYYLEQSQRLETSLNLPSLTIQYKDFALWQRSYLSGERLEKELAYWKNKLEGYETINLITDKTRPNQIDYRGAHVSFEIDEATSKALREIAKELKVSLYSVLLSGYYLMLQAYSYQNDIVIGTPIANRHYSQIEYLIGFFVNSLALRIEINPKISIKEFIQKVGREVVEAQLHQDLPFEKLVDELKIAKDTSRHPIFQVMFAVQNFRKELYQKGMDWLQPYTTGEGLYNAAKFDISTFIDDSQNELRGSFNYAVSLYTETTIIQFIKTYLQILKQIVKLALNSQEQLASLNYLDEEQYHQIVNIWNKIDNKYSEDKTIEQLFEEQVKKTPNNVAVVFEGVKFNYRQLNEKVNQLANYLQDNYTVKPGMLIALCMDRSEDLVVAIISILKIGCAYVPLDPHYPDDRIQYILRDSQTKLILTNKLNSHRLEKLIKMLDTETTIKLLAIDCNQFQDELRIYSTNNPNNITTIKDLAYVMYTSGTTGVPKGIMMEHESCVLRILYMIRKNKLSSNDCVLFKTNIVFDVSFSDMFVALLSGATLYITKEVFDVEEIKDILEKANINICHFVPSQFNVIKQEIDFNKFNKLDRLMFSGEALDTNTLKSFIGTNKTILNYYGPTETGEVTLAELTANDLSLLKDNISIIGKPFLGSSVYVLNDVLKPLPPGAIGELYISGSSLARGYLNSPELTSQKFIPNPFQSEADSYTNKNARLYKTGDLVRWLPDGNLEYIGRNDFQIKIRGHRIELGEIESVLSSHEAIKHSVVLAKNYQNGTMEPSGSHYLIGYYISEDKLNNEDLLNYLQLRLPEYMVPRALIRLERFPLTVNGKLDRKALPIPEFLNEESYVAPRNEVEDHVCRIWSEVLGLPKDKIGIKDDFFKLGGNSILAIRLISKINHYYQSHLKVADVFVYKTIEFLFPRIIQTKDSYQTVVKLNNTDGKPNMFMIHPAGGGCEVYASLANLLTESFSCYGIDSYNLYHEDKNKISNFHELARYYLSLIDEIMKKTNQKEYHLLGWSLGGMISLEIASILEKRGERINTYLLDPILLDDYLLSFVGELDLDIEERKNDLYDYGISKGYDKLYMNKVVSNLATERKLARYRMKFILNKTKVLLFKAMQEDPSVKTRKISQYSLSLKYNNIDTILKNKSNLKVINVKEAHHGNILEQAEVLVSEIRAFRKFNLVSTAIITDDIERGSYV